MEIAAEDLGRAKEFYKSVFEWDFEKTEGDMEYYMAETDGKNSFGLGLMKRQNPDHKTTPYITVDSVDEAAKLVEKNGGKVIMPKQEVPGMGWFIICIDTEENGFALWENV